jgi:hypothetical protein
MTDIALDTLTIYRTLTNGSTLRKTADGRRLFLVHADGRLAGEIVPGDTTAQLLGLTAFDFGEQPRQSDPSIVAGPPAAAPPPRSETERRNFAAAVREWRRRLFGR